VVPCETGRGQLEGCGEHRMERSESGLISYSELRGGSLHPCWLRTDHLAQVSKFDYVLLHTGFMGSRKLSSFDGCQVGQSLTSSIVMYTGIVYRPPTNSQACGIKWKICTWERCNLAWLFDRCHELWPLVVPSWLMCVVLSGCYHARCKLIWISAKPSDMVDTCLLQSFPRSAISPMFIWDLCWCLIMTTW
jgi:hypothetical protein